MDSHSSSRSKFKPAYFHFAKALITLFSCYQLKTSAVCQRASRKVLRASDIPAPLERSKVAR